MPHRLRSRLAPCLALTFVLLAGCAGDEFTSQTTGSGGGASSSAGTAGGGSTGEGGGGGGGAGEGGGSPMCSIPSDCLAFPCRTADCVDGQCQWEPLPTTTQLEQVEGDCQDRICNADGTEGSVTNPDDIPPDDNDCTTGACQGTVPQQTPVMAGAACDDDTGVCSASGMCVQCLTPNHCNPTQCQIPACVGNVCMFTPREAGVGCGSQDQCDGAGNCVDCVNVLGCVDCGPTCLCNNQNMCQQP